MAGQSRRLSFHIRVSRFPCSGGATAAPGSAEGSPGKALAARGLRTLRLSESPGHVAAGTRLRPGGGANPASRRRRHLRPSESRDHNGTCHVARCFPHPRKSLASVRWCCCFEVPPTHPGGGKWRVDAEVTAPGKVSASLLQRFRLRAGILGRAGRGACRELWSRAAPRRAGEAHKGGGACRVLCARSLAAGGGAACLLFSGVRGTLGPAGWAGTEPKIPPGPASAGAGTEGQAEQLVGWGLERPLRKGMIRSRRVCIRSPRMSSLLSVRRGRGWL